MAGVQIVLSPAGNSLKILEIADPELQDQVKQLYAPFWAVWSGPFNMVTMSVVLIVLLPIMLLSIWAAWVEGEWLLVILGIAGLWIVWQGAAMVVGEVSSIRNGRKDFARLTSQLSRASEALQSLRRIEPWRMWLLKPWLTIVAKTPPRYRS